MNEFLPYINIAGFVLMIIGFSFAQLKWGGKGVAKEVIDTYRARQDQLEALLKDAQAQIAQLGLDIATMKGQLVEKDKKLLEFTKIFQDKSPELIAILAEIRDFMKTINEQGIVVAKRNKKMDRATDSGLGKVTRNTKTTNE